MSFSDAFSLSGILTLCFVVSGICQTIWLKSKLFKKFAYPIDFNLKLSETRIFGDNKTFAVFIVMIPATIITFLLAGMLLIYHYKAFLININWPLNIVKWSMAGFLAAVGFYAGELPNSFFKRRIGISPGESPADPVLKIVCFILDHTDSTIGSLLLLSLWLPTGLYLWIIMLLMTPIVHWLFNVALFFLKIKKKPY